MNQQVLEQELGVSGSDINIIVDKMMARNIHGKLTGAGGDGGCVLGFYMPSSDSTIADIAMLNQELEELKYTVYQDIKISTQGIVKIE